jgi:putative transposase
MARYLRNYVPGGTYFFTVVTYQRRPILTTPESRSILREAFQSVRRRWPFTITAIVLLPEHLHTVWTLPEGDANYSLRWQKIKEHFTSGYQKAVGDVAVRRPRSGERAVWQPRFWEHTCSDVDDLKRCVDYVHYNPLKHGYVTRVRDWPWSSFHRYVKLGEYSLDWGTVDPCPKWTQPEF